MVLMDSVAELSLSNLLGISSLAATRASSRTCPSQALVLMHAEDGGNLRLQGVTS